MSGLDSFREILIPEASLADLTDFRVGGPAEWLAHPRDPDELARLLACCRREAIPYRMLGGGSYILAPDEGVRGVVIRLNAPSFRAITVVGTRISAGAGASLADLIAQACNASLTGLEVLVGIPGTLGGALRHNVGDRTGDIGQFVHSVEVMDGAGAISQRMRADIRFGQHSSNLDDVIILAATLELAEDDPADIVRRVKKMWMGKRASQPSHNAAVGDVFLAPRGQQAGDLIDRTGLRGARVGGAEVCDRDPSYIVIHPDATSRDVQRLLELVLKRVAERTSVSLTLQIAVWH